MTAYVFLAEGFEEVEALTPVDILRRGGVTVKTVGIGGKTITGAHGIPVGCDIAEEDVIPDEIDMMVLPGGMPGTTHLGESLTIQEGLAYAAQEDLWVAAICAAPSVLGENGLLHGKSLRLLAGADLDVYADAGKNNNDGRHKKQQHLGLQTHVSSRPPRSGRRKGDVV